MSNHFLTQKKKQIYMLCTSYKVKKYGASEPTYATYKDVCKDV